MHDQGRSFRKESQVSTQQVKERHVNITPLKRPREQECDDDDDDDNYDDDEVDAYKEWLA